MDDLERCFEKMQQACRKTSMPKCDFNKVALQIAHRHWCSPVNLMHILRTPFYKSSYGGLLLNYAVVIFYPSFAGFVTGINLLLYFFIFR